MHWTWSKYVSAPTRTANLITSQLSYRKQKIIELEKHYVKNFSLLGHPSEVVVAATYEQHEQEKPYFRCINKILRDP